MSLYYLVKRNMMLYFKDKAAVFFSVLSVLIVLMLMVVFLGDMNQEELLSMLKQLTGAENSASDILHAQQVILMWTIAGMLAVNSFTVPLTMIGTYVQDKQYHKLESFFCAPISRMTLLSGYLISAILNGMIMCSITLLLSYGYILSQGLTFLTLMEILQVYGVLLVCVSVSSCLILLLSQFLHTNSAWGSFSTIAGTLIGFLGGIYLPISMLPSAVQSVLKALPFLHQAGLLRELFTKSAVSSMFEGLPSAVPATYNEMMGIEITIFDQVVSPAIQITLLVLCGIIALAVAIYLLKKHTPFDR